MRLNDDFHFQYLIYAAVSIYEIAGNIIKIYHYTLSRNCEGQKHVIPCAMRWFTVIDYASFLTQLRFEFLMPLIEGWCTCHAVFR